MRFTMAASLFGQSGEHMQKYAMQFLLSITIPSGLFAADVLVSSRAEFKQALRTAGVGDSIVLTAGVSYIGSFVLPNKGVRCDIVHGRLKWPPLSRPFFARNTFGSGGSDFVGAAEAAPAIPALESALGSHLCVALSSAQVPLL